MASTSKSKRRGRPPKSKKPAQVAATSVMFAGEAVVGEVKEEVKPEVKAAPVADPFSFLSELPQVKQYAEKLVLRMGVDKEDLIRSLFVKTWKESRSQVSESAMATRLNELLDRAKRGLRL